MDTFFRRLEGRRIEFLEHLVAKRSRDFAFQNWMYLCTSTVSNGTSLCGGWLAGSSGAVFEVEPFWVGVVAEITDRI